MDSYTVLSIMGLFIIIAAVFDWDWFMNPRNRRLVSLIGNRNRARIFYAV